MTPASATADARSGKLLELAGLSGGYGRTQVLHGVDLSVGEGEVVSLIGRNGMGKTTTMRMIMGLLKPARGSITFRGHAITARPPEEISRRGIGYVPEGRGIFPGLSVTENLIMAARPGRWSLQDVYRLFPRLEERRGHQGHELSGGEQQMLSIGRALLLDPSLILLDEATEGLAPLVQDEIWAAIGAISGTGTAILVVDKDLDALRRVATRHYVMQKGEIRWAGRTEDLGPDGGELERFLTV